MTRAGLAIVTALLGVALLLPLVAGGQLSPARAAEAKLEGPSGVRGKVTVSPKCGGPQQVPLTPPCEPAPLRVAIRIESYATGRALRTVHSHSDGRYRATLRPGRYTLIPLEVQDRPRPTRPYPSWVRVKASRYSTRNFDYDSGLR